MTFGCQPASSTCRAALGLEEPLPRGRNRTTERMTAVPLPPASIAQSSAVRALAVAVGLRGNVRAASRSSNAQISVVPPV
jgi:hypothetical protein